MCFYECQCYLTIYLVQKYYVICTTCDSCRISSLVKLKIINPDKALCWYNLAGSIHHHLGNEHVLATFNNLINHITNL